MINTYFDYKKMMIEINNYMNKYSFLSVSGLCESMLGNVVPVLMLGEGKCVITYVGGEDGNDIISPLLLLRFVRDICSLYEEKGAAFGFSAENILKNYTIVIIPMLNPDGCCYYSFGVREDNPLRERVLKINGDNNDFSLWKGNARGVELTYNYGLENTEYESEPEVGNLCNFLKYGITPDILIAFHKSNDSNGALYFGEGEAENKISIALSQMSGLKRIYRDNQTPNMMLADWVIGKLNSSAFSVDLPSLNYISQKQFEDKNFSLYAKMRKMLFCTPFLNKMK